MTREEARQNLIALGIEEPTDGQVTNYLNQFHANRNPQPQPNPAPAPQPIPQPNPQDPPSNNEEMEQLRQQVAQLQSENAKKDILAYATSKGLTGDQVANVLAAYGDNVDAAKASIDAICSIISERETAAATAKEQEIANKAGNPGGGNGTGGVGNDNKPADVLNAESISFGSASSEQSQKDFYVIK